MSQTTPVNTATATAAAAVVAPVVAFAADSMHLALPPQVQAAVVVAVVAGAHWAGQQISGYMQQISAYLAAKQAVIAPAPVEPATPVAPPPAPQP